MANLTDEELEAKVREELYMGGVQAAEDWAGDIKDWALQRDMKQLIHEYEGGNHEGEYA